MSRLRGTLLFSIMASAASCAAAVEPATTVLQDLRQHGYASPLAALQRLRATPVPAADAPLDLRWRFQAALAQFGARTDDHAVAQAARAELLVMATRENCAPCRVELTLLDAGQALHDTDMPAIRRDVERLSATPMPADTQLHVEALDVLAQGRLEMGQNDLAIEAAVKESELAAATGRPADDASAFNELVSGTASRHDMRRAVALATEGYARAERIGFSYAMVLIRCTESYARSELKDDPARWRAALYDGLRLARSAPGLQRLELTLLTNTAHFHNVQHEYEAAKRFASQGEALARKLGNERGRAYAIVNLGLAQLHSGEVEGGLRQVREAVDILERLGLKGGTRDLLAHLVDADEQAGHYREALEAMRRWAQLDAELTRSERDKDVLALEERYSADRKTREIERLELESATRAAEVTARTLQQRLWAAVAVAVTLAALMLAQWLSSARRRGRALEADNAKLSEETSHDPLTGTFNRRHCDTLMARLAREQRPAVGLMLVDVDFFKKVNDSHGHAAGDTVLVEVARRLQALLRDQDAVVRWGGEEFVLVLPGTSAESLPAVAERVLSAIALDPIDVGDAQLAVQVSGGAVAWPAWPGQRWEEALHVADLALYLSKTGGRHRVTCVSTVAEDAPLELLHHDLGAARDAGHVTLCTVPGAAHPVRAAVAA